MSEVEQKAVASIEITTQETIKKIDELVQQDPDLKQQFKKFVNSIRENNTLQNITSQVNSFYNYCLESISPTAIHEPYDSKKHFSKETYQFSNVKGSFKVMSVVEKAKLDRQKAIIKILSALLVVLGSATAIFHLTETHDIKEKKPDINSDGQYKTTKTIRR
jgi:hypothetical protein